MGTLGRIFWLCSQLMWLVAIVGHWFIDNKINSIYMLSMTIGLMFISNRTIDDAQHEKSDNDNRWWCVPLRRVNDRPGRWLYQEPRPTPSCAYQNTDIQKKRSSLFVNNREKLPWFPTATIVAVALPHYSQLSGAELRITFACMRSFADFLIILLIEEVKFGWKKFAFLIKLNPNNPTQQVY